MAVKHPKSSRFNLVYEEGVDNDGNPIFRRSGYAVQPEASVEDLYTVGVALSTLSQSDLADLELTENSYIMDN